MKGNYELWILNFELRDKKAIMKGKLGTEPLFFWRPETEKIGEGRQETGGRRIRIIRDIALLFSP